MNSPDYPELASDTGEVDNFQFDSSHALDAADATDAIHEEDLFQQVTAAGQEVNALHAQMKEMLATLGASLPDPSLADPLIQLFDSVQKEHLTRSLVQVSLLETRSKRLMRAWRHNAVNGKKIQTMRSKVGSLTEENATLTQKFNQAEKQERALSAMLDALSWKYKVLKVEYYNELMGTNVEPPSIDDWNPFDPTNSQRAGSPFFGSKAEQQQQPSGATSPQSPKSARRAPSPAKRVYMTQEIGAERKDGSVPRKPVDESHAPDISSPTGTVSFVFTDIDGFMDLMEKEEVAMHCSLLLHNALIRKHMLDHNGYEVKAEGGAFMIAFSSAFNAIRFCCSVQSQLLKVAWPDELRAHPQTAVEKDPEGKIKFAGLRVRMGVHVGNPVCERDPLTNRVDYFGSMVSIAARTTGKAAGGQIVATGEFVAIIRESLTFIGDGVAADSMGEFTFPGISYPIELFSLTPNGLKSRTFSTVKNASSATGPTTGNAASQFPSAPSTWDNKAFINGSPRILPATSPEGSGSPKIDPLDLASGNVAATRALVRTVKVGLEVQRLKELGYLNALRSVKRTSTTFRVTLEQTQTDIEQSITKCRRACKEIVVQLGDALGELLSLFLSERTELRTLLANRQRITGCKNCIDGCHECKPNVPKFDVLVEPLAQLSFLPLAARKNLAQAAGVEAAGGKAAAESGAGTPTKGISGTDTPTKSRPRNFAPAALSSNHVKSLMSSSSEDSDRDSEGGLGSPQQLASVLKAIPMLPPPPAAAPSHPLHHPKSPPVPMPPSASSNLAKVGSTLATSFPSFRRRGSMGSSLAPATLPKLSIQSMKPPSPPPMPEIAGVGGGAGLMKMSSLRFSRVPALGPSAGISPKDRAQSPKLTPNKSAAALSISTFQVPIAGGGSENKSGVLGSGAVLAPVPPPFRFEPAKPPGPLNLRRLSGGARQLVPKPPPPPLSQPN